MPGPDGKPGALVGGASLYVVDTGDDVRTAASWDFITYLTAAQQQSEWSSVTGYVPVRTDALTLDPLKTTLATDPRFKVAYDQLLSSPDVPTSRRSDRRPTARGSHGDGARRRRDLRRGRCGDQPWRTVRRQADALIADYNSRNG